RSQIRRTYLKFALGYIDRTIRLLSETETIIKAVTGIGVPSYGIESSYFVIESTNNPSRGIPLRALGSRAYVRLAEASSQADVPKTMSFRARLCWSPTGAGLAAVFDTSISPGQPGDPDPGRKGCRSSASESVLARLWYPQSWPCRRWVTHWISESKASPSS